ncbi:MAG: eCIS core domain-containing protein [Myxococcota bacterium]
MDTAETGKGFSRRKAPERALDLQLEELEREEARSGEALSEEPHAALTASVHEVLGNAMLQGSLGGDLDGIGGILHEAMSMGAAGVHVASDVHGLLANSFVNDWMGTHGAGADPFGGQAVSLKGGQAAKEGIDTSSSALKVVGQGGGAPLPSAVLARMEAAFGHDFSDVRIHTGSVVARSAEALNAKAYAIGKDIYFGDGRFAPGTREGDRLLAHELQHVVQADEGRLPGATGPGMDVSSPTDSHEVEAERVAEQIASGLAEGGAPAVMEAAPVELSSSALVSSADAGVVSREEDEDGISFKNPLDVKTEKGVKSTTRGTHAKASAESQLGVGAQKTFKLAQIPINVLGEKLELGAQLKLTAFAGVMGKIEASAQTNWRGGGRTKGIPKVDEFLEKLNEDITNKGKSPDATDITEGEVQHSRDRNARKAAIEETRRLGDERSKAEGELAWMKKKRDEAFADPKATTESKKAWEDSVNSQEAKVSDLATRHAAVKIPGETKKPNEGKTAGYLASGTDKDGTAEERYKANDDSLRNDKGVSGGVNAEVFAGVKAGAELKTQLEWHRKASNQYNFEKGISRMVDLIKVGMPMIAPAILIAEQMKGKQGVVELVKGAAAFLLEFGPEKTELAGASLAFEARAGAGASAKFALGFTGGKFRWVAAAGATWGLGAKFDTDWGVNMLDGGRLALVLIGDDQLKELLGKVANYSKEKIQQGVESFLDGWNALMGWLSSDDRAREIVSQRGHTVLPARGRGELLKNMLVGMINVISDDDEWASAQILDFSKKKGDLEAVLQTAGKKDILSAVQGFDVPAYRQLALRALDAGGGGKGGRAQRKEKPGAKKKKEGRGLQKGGGSQMGAGVRERMEGAFGADFSGVRIHTGGAASEMSEDISARAFTHGQDIFFNQGEYQPDTGAGQELLAHELAHVVQQGGAGMARTQPKLSISSPGDMFEQEADKVASQVGGLLKKGISVGDEQNGATLGLGKGGPTLDVRADGKKGSVSREGASFESDKVSAKVGKDGASFKSDKVSGKVGKDGVSVEAGDFSAKVGKDGASVEGKVGDASFSADLSGEGASAELEIGGAKLNIGSEGMSVNVGGGARGGGERRSEGGGSPGPRGGAGGGRRQAQDGFRTGPRSQRPRLNGPGGALEGLRRRAGSGMAMRSVMRKGKGAGAVVSGFLGDKPSVRAKGWASFGNNLSVGVQADVQDVNDAKPQVHVTVDLKGTSKGGGKGDDTKKRAVGDTGGPKAKKDDVSARPPTPQPPPTTVNARQQPAPRVSVPAEATPEEGQRAAKAALNQVSTKSGVSASAGPRPKVPLKDGTDPQKTAQAKQEGKQEADQAKQKAKQEVLQGRGPEAIKEQLMDVAQEAKDVFVQGATTQPAAVDGVDRYLQYGVPGDVEAQFDTDQQAVMDASLETARTKMDEAVTKRDEEQEKLLTKAAQDEEKLRAEAESQQRAEIDKARGDISKAREDALAQQDAEIAKLDAEATSRQQAEVQKIKARASEDEAKIESEYAKAEKQADSKVREAEAEAERKKREEEKKADDRSWWDRVKDAVSSVFEAITSALNALFDKLKQAVTFILDKVKSLATSIIDAATKWITDTIKAFGSWLKERINETIGKVFPGIAKKLNGLIDAAVDYTCKKVEQIGEKLKNGVNALCDWISEGLNKLISLYQSAVNFVTTLVEAAITGDWGKVARMVLEAVLKLAGIPPEEFFEIVGKAEESLDIIVADPGAFAGNVVDGLGAGFSQFGDNFGTNFQKGFLEWVTQGLAKAGIASLASLDLKDIFGFVLDTIGINKEYIRKKAVANLGEKNVERIEWVMDVVGTAMEGGWDGLWEYAQGYVDGWYDLVIGQITEFITTRVVQAAIIKIASMFNPVGAIVQAIITVWNVIQFVRTQIQRIWGVAKAIIESINDLARGNIQKAADLVEQALVKLIPVAIDLLARLLGVTGIPEKVGGLVKKLQAKVDAVIDKVLEKIKSMAGKVAGKMGFGKKDEKKADDPKNKDKDKDSPDYGPAETFSAEGYSHTIFVETPAGGAGSPTLVMHSVKRPMREQLDRIRTAIKDRYKGLDAKQKKDDPSIAAERKDVATHLKTAWDLTKELDNDLTKVGTKDVTRGHDAKDTGDPVKDGIRDKKKALAEAMQALYKKFLSKAVDPNLEKRRQDFEMQKLGPHAYTHRSAVGVVKHMCRKAWAYMEAKAEELSGPTGDVKKELEAIVKKTGEDLEAPGRFIGQVGKNMKKIKEVFLGDGNLEEQTTHLVGFHLAVFGKDVLAMPKGKLTKILERLRAHKVKVEEVMAQRATLLKDADMEGKGTDDERPSQEWQDKKMKTSAVLSKPGEDNVDMQKENKGGMDFKLAPSRIDKLDDDRLRAFARMMGLKYVTQKKRETLIEELNAIPNPKMAGKDLKKDGDMLMTLEGEKHPGAWTTRKRQTINTAGSKGTKTEQDEAAKQNPYYMSSRQSQGVSPMGKEFLPTIDGDLANILWEFDPFIELSKEMSMPLRAGASGNTERFCQMAEWFTLDVASTRLAMMGHLLPIQAHSYHEIMTAAAGHGGLTYKRGDYTKIEPLPDSWEQEERQAISETSDRGTVGVKGMDVPPDPAA